MVLRLDAAGPRPSVLPPPGLAPAEARLETRELAISFPFCFPALQAARGGTNPPGPDKINLLDKPFR